MNKVKKGGKNKYKKMTRKWRKGEYATGRVRKEEKTQENTKAKKEKVKEIKLNKKGREMEERSNQHESEYDTEWKRGKSQNQQRVKREN